MNCTLIWDVWKKWTFVTVFMLILSSSFVETTGLGVMAFQICVYIENRGRVNKYFVGNVCTMLLLALVYIIIAKEGTPDTKGEFKDVQYYNGR